MAAAQSVDQAGFRKEFACDDHLFAITMLYEKTKEWNKPLWLAAVDFQKAFDTVNHEAIWQALREQGVGETYVRTLQKLYRGQVGHVKTDRTSRDFEINRGTKQGDPISPVIFNAVLETVMRTCKHKWRSKRIWR